LRRYTKKVAEVNSELDAAVVQILGNSELDAAVAGPGDITDQI